MIGNAWYRSDGDLQISNDGKKRRGENMVPIKAYEIITND